MELGRDQVYRIAAFRPRRADVLSLVLDISPQESQNRTYHVVRKSLFDELRRRVPEEKRRPLEAEIEKVDDYFERHFTPHGLGVAVYSCIPEDFWEVVFLHTRPRDQAHYDTIPYIRPLVDLLDEYDRYAVLLLNKARARLFFIELAKVVEADEFADLIVKKHKQGGWSAADFQRHHETHVVWHVKHTLEELREFEARHPFDRLVVAGPTEVLSTFVDLLPKELESKLAGTFTARIIAPPEEILYKTLELEQALERDEELSLVEQTLELAAKGGPAVVGLDDTVAAAMQNRIMRLLLTETLRPEGYECAGCGFIATRPDGDACALCGGPLVHVNDLIESLIRAMLRQQARVELVRGKGGEKLDAVGGVAALLRF